MLRRLSHSLSRASTEDTDTDEFRCRGAVRFDEDVARGRSRQSVTLDTYLSDEEEDFYRGTTLEALSLEPIMQQSYEDVRSHIQPAEILLPPPAVTRDGSRTKGFLDSAPAANNVRLAIRHEPVLLRRPAPRIVVTPPASERPDPMEMLDQLAPLPIRIAKPARPGLQRNAVSHREDRELPLRVQAIRRSHQELLARELSARPLLQPSPRRASEPLVRYNVPTPHSTVPAPRGNARARPDVLPPQMPPPSAPLPALPETEPATRGRVPYVPASAAQMRRSPSVPMRPSQTSAEVGQMRRAPTARDYYLELAEMDWRIGDDLQLM